MRSTNKEWLEAWKKHKIFLHEVLDEIGKKHPKAKEVLADLEKTKFKIKHYQKLV